MGLSGGVASLFTYPYVRDADWFAAGVPPYGNLYEYQRKQDTMTDLPQSLPQAWRPPMGWNSWDSYGTTLTEDELLANARFMAEHLKNAGWDTLVIDIDWYDPTARAHGYNDNAPLILDEYGRQLPDPVRFPSSAGGKGFGPLAAAVHELLSKILVALDSSLVRALGADSETYAACTRSNEGIVLFHDVSGFANAIHKSLKELRLAVGHVRLGNFHGARASCSTRGIHRGAAHLMVCLNADNGGAPLLSSKRRHCSAGAETGHRNVNVVLPFFRRLLLCRSAPYSKRACRHNARYRSSFKKISSVQIHVSYYLLEPKSPSMGSLCSNYLTKTIKRKVRKGFCAWYFSY